MGKVFSTISIILVLATPLSAKDIEIPERPHFTNYEALENYRMTLYREHAGCAETAKYWDISRSEVVACTHIYLLLKLSFLNGVSFERYINMPAKTKAVANNKGYAAFRAWMYRHVVRSEIED